MTDKTLYFADIEYATAYIGIVDTVREKTVLQSTTGPDLMQQLDGFLGCFVHFKHAVVDVVFKKNNDVFAHVEYSFHKGKIINVKYH